MDLPMRKLVNILYNPYSKLDSSKLLTKAAKENNKFISMESKNHKDSF